MTKFLVEDWRDAWKWLSMHFATALLIWSQLSEEKQAAILSLFGWTPDNLVGVLALLAIVGRLLSQRRPADPPTLTDQT